MKDVKTSLLERTSVRRYEREPIPQETMDMIYKAVENTPTSYNGQQFSVIDISDQELKEKLYELTNQKQLKTCNRLLIFCSDYNKITRLAEKKGFDVPPFTDTMDGVTIGIIDASLAMMSAVVAAQGSRPRKQLRGLSAHGGSGKSRRTPEASERRLRGLRPRARRTPRTARPEAEAASIARVPPELLPSGHGQDDRRAGGIRRDREALQPDTCRRHLGQRLVRPHTRLLRHAMEYRILDYLKPKATT